MFGKNKSKNPVWEEVLDRDMDYEAVIKLLSNVDGDTEVNFGYEKTYKLSVEFEDLKLSDAVMFLKKEFKPVKDKNYFRATYQAYMSNSDERHNLKIEKGGILITIGTREVHEGPSDTISLEYYLGRRK